ncbi:MAG: hypothetical protein WCI73_09320 [Phycisphaerae bacterium]
MSQSIEQIRRCDDLIYYAQSEGRICPMPQLWNEIWEMLPDRRRVGGGWHPPLPLILAAWSETSASEKRQRFAEHLRYAAEHGVMEQVERVVRSLRPDQWAYEEKRAVEERFTLHNKLSKKLFANLPTDFPFDKLPESGILAVPVVFVDRIGTETALLLFDKTPFIYEIVKLRPFTLRMITGLLRTSHGTVMFLLFYVPDPRSPEKPFFTMEVHLNPLDPQMVLPWCDLARQTHWHLVLLDAQGQQVDFFEFENTFDLVKALEVVGEACKSEKCGNFNAAKQEFTEQYSLEDLFRME